jgi:hypothetical protein
MAIEILKKAYLQIVSEPTFGYSINQVNGMRILLNAISYLRRYDPNGINKTHVDRAYDMPYGV